jgi:uncharacterized protein with beta-barrel porin domain
MVESSQNAALVNALLVQSDASIRQAFDALSGEIHASARTVILEDSLYAREAMLGRLRQVSYGSAPGAMAALGSGGPALAYAENASAQSASDTEGARAYARPRDARAAAFPVKAPPAAPAASPDLVFWLQGLGAWGHADSDGNAAAVRRDLAGFFTGFDRRFGDWRAGLAAGYTNSQPKADARASSATVDTGHFGAYAGGSAGAWNVRSGAELAWSSVSTNRSIVFPGFSEVASARYNAGLAQGVRRSRLRRGARQYRGRAVRRLGLRPSSQRQLCRERRARRAQRRQRGSGCWLFNARPAFRNLMGPAQRRGRASRRHGSMPSAT